MKKHLAATKIQKIVRGKQLRQHLIEIDEVISKLKTDGTPEEHANNISYQLLKSLKNGCLDLEHLDISDDILNEILPLLSVLNITSLYLGDNDLGPEGATALAEALKINTSLKKLNLYDNNLGDAGAKALAKALEENKSLTTLSLILNNIRPDGAIALADALKINSNLRTLYLLGNDIGPEGATAIAKALEENKSLTTLNLFGNNLGDDLGKIIKKELKINNEITEFSKKDNTSNIKFTLFKCHLFWILNSKSTTNIANHIVPIIANYLRSDYMSDEAARKFLNKSGSNQHQPNPLAAEEDPNPEEQSSKKQKLIP